VTEQISKGAVRFSVSVPRDPDRRANPYDLYQKIEDLDTRFREHVDKEESFWTDMNEMKAQISSMFLAANWLVKIIRTTFITLVAIGSAYVAVREWFLAHP
jgi:hypothetical protein